MKSKKSKIAALLFLAFFCAAFSVSADDATSTVSLLIRNNDAIIYQSALDLPPEGAVDIADSAGELHSIDARSVLAVLWAADQTSDEFSISDLQYYSSFNSFYLKCITPKDALPSCDSWQYVVDNATPFTGMDATLLSGNETVGLYFGSPHRLSFNTTSITAGESFVASAEKYNYLYNTWSPLTGVVVGVTSPNPDDPYNPTVVATSTVDENGRATTTLAAPGTYGAGIAEDYYFPSYTITVSAPPDASSTPPETGGGGAPTPASFSVPGAVAYLLSKQSEDGSFGGSDMHTDWAAIALGAYGASREKIIGYMSAHNSLSSLPTDNERRAVALLSLGENPYSFRGTDYIASIKNSFDGTQFGDPALINDDIFALIPLSRSGYSANDDIIAKDIAFIISKQKSNGSWEESADMTAAAIQALAPFSSASGVSDSLAKASSFLENSQMSDGGWGNVYSTSWAMQAMSALGASWTKNDKTGNDYLAINQASDGAALTASETLQNRIWATSYAIPGAQGKPWNAIMRPVAKPAEPSVSSTASGGNETKQAEGNQTAATTTTATSTESASAASSTALTLNPPTTPLVLGAAEEEKAEADQTQEKKDIPLPDEKNFQSSLLAAAAENETKMPTPIVLAVAAAALSLWLLSRWFVKP